MYKTYMSLFNTKGLVFSIVLLLGVIALNVYRVNKDSEISVGMAKSEDISDKVDSKLSNFPTYPQALLTRLTNDNNTLHAEWEIGGNLTDIADWYKNEFHNMGWQITSVGEGSDSQVFEYLSATKGKEKVVLTITAKDKMNLITSDYTSEKP